MPEYFTGPSGRRIAYHQSAGKGPGVVFLGGFMSDMDGTKAAALSRWAQAQGRAFLRFDYSGHGQSDGAFEEGAIGDWAADARGIIEALTQGPQILVGSSMGGWISLILAGLIPEKIAGLVGIAAAPDFTEDGFWASFGAEQRAQMARDGRVMVPSDYDAPYPITKRLIEEGRDHLVLRKPMHLPFPVRLLQGTADMDVDVSRPLAILDHANCDDMRLTLVKGADHSFSTPVCLVLIEKTVEKVMSRARA